MTTPSSLSSRRGFLAAAAGTATTLLLHPLAAWADPGVAAIVAATIGIDCHNHVDVPLVASELPGPDLDLAGAINTSGLAAICMTFAVDYQPLRHPGDAFERFQNGMAALDRQLARNGMRRSLHLADLRALRAQGQPTVIQSVEGGHFLEGHLERLDLAYARGLRHLTLLHDNDASVPLGDVFTNPVRWGGLTAFGAQVIGRCERLGILVDLGHADAATVAGALKVATRPVIVSHTGLDTQLGSNPKMAQMMRPRLISRDVALTVARAGGVIGVWTHLAESAQAYAENVRAMVDVVGIDHVCIGTDTKMTAATRGTNDTWPGQPAGFYFAVVDAMLKAGFTVDEIGKVGGGNFCRVFGRATSA
jgi:membrane dipeptidase